MRATSAVVMGETSCGTEVDGEADRDVDKGGDVGLGALSLEDDAGSGVCRYQFRKIVRR